MIPKEFIPAVQEGVKEALSSGVLSGYQVIDIKVSLLDGSFHEVDSSELAFKIAASRLLKSHVTGKARTARTNYESRDYCPRGIYGW